MPPITRQCGPSSRPSPTLSRKRTRQPSDDRRVLQIAVVNGPAERCFEEEDRGQRDGPGHVRRRIDLTALFRRDARPEMRPRTQQDVEVAICRAGGSGESNSTCPVMKTPSCVPAVVVPARKSSRRGAPRQKCRRIVGARIRPASRIASRRQSRWPHPRRRARVSVCGKWRAGARPGVVRAEGKRRRGDKSRRHADRSNAYGRRARNPLPEDRYWAFGDKIPQSGTEGRADG